MLAEGAEKAAVIQQYHTGQPYFVETGSGGSGTTVSAVASLGVFERCFSFEIDHFNYFVGVEHTYRFGNVTMIHGDSGEIFSMFMDWWRVPCMFYLDAHGPDRDDPTPIKAELAAIFYRPWGHVILIDDARLFGDFTHWPPLEWIQEQAELNGYSYELADDIIRLVPK